MTRKVDQGGLPQPLHSDKLPHIASKPAIIASEALPWRTREWNTRHLPWRMTSDVVAAGTASGLVSPLIAAIDRYVQISAHNVWLCKD